MNKTSPLQKQDLNYINNKLDKIIELLEKLIEIVQDKKE